MAKPTLRFVLLMVALLLLALAAAWGLRPAPLAVETTVATRGDLTATVVAEGRVRVKDVYVVAAPGRPQLVGRRLLAIQGRPIADVLRLVDPLVTYDNPLSLAAHRSPYLVTAEVLHGLQHGARSRQSAVQPMRTVRPAHAVGMPDALVSRRCRTAA